MESCASSYKDPLAAFFETFSDLEIKQDIQGDPSDGRFRNWVKYAGHEIPNTYSVRREGREVGLITEQNEGWVPFSLKSAFLRGHRPARLTVQDEDGQVILSLFRPFYFLFSRMIIRDQRGRVRGFIRQKFLFNYELFTRSSSRPFAFFSNPVGVVWNRPVLDRQKKQIGEIRKKWGGVGREFLTLADTFTVKWGDLSLEQKIVLFSTVIHIDFDWFERH